MRWFYIENAEDSHSTDIDTMVGSNVNWTMRPSSEEMHQVEKLLDILARTDINGVGVIVNFIVRWIQPYKERCHPAYEFYDEDFIREALERLERSEIAIRA